MAHGLRQRRITGTALSFCCKLASGIIDLRRKVVDVLRLLPLLQVRNQEVIMPSCRGVVSSSCATRCAASHTPEVARRVVAARQLGRRVSVSAHAALPTHSGKAFQAQHILFYDPHASTPRPLDQQPHSNQTAPAQPAAGQLQPEGPVKGFGVPANAEAEMRRQRRRARVFIVARALSSTLYKLLRGLPKRLSAVHWDCDVAPEEAAEALFRVLFTTSKDFSTTRLEAALRLGILPELATLPARAGTPASPVVTVTANSVTVTSDPTLQPELQPQQLLPPDRAGDEVVVPQQHAVDLLALLSKGPMGCEEVDEQDVEAALGPLPHEWYAVVDTVRVSDLRQLSQSGQQVNGRRVDNK